MRCSVISRTVILRSLAIAIVFTAPFAAVAQKRTLPPLIDRELFFGNPEISGAQISPDGRYISFLKPYKDTRNIWVKRIGDPYTAAKLMTNDTKRPVTQYFWSRDGKYILYVQDQLGDENYNVYAVDPTSAPAAGQEVPTARNLTAAKSVRAAIYSVPRNDPDVMYVGLNDRGTQTEQLIESDPLNRVDFGNASFSDLSGQLVATAYDDERVRIYCK